MSYQIETSLSNKDEDHDYLLDDYKPARPVRWYTTERYGFISTILVAALVFLLVILNLLTLQGLRRKDETKSTIDTQTLLAGVHTTQTMHTLTPFSSPDRHTADAAWNTYKINGFVALPHSWISDLTSAKGPFGRPMPSDSSKGIYVVDGMHQLHCLMSVRTLAQGLLDGIEPANRTHVQQHLDHCYDALRQAIVCRADPTPLYMPEGDSFWSGDGQERTCGDWRALEEWTLQHTACYGGVECWADEGPRAVHDAGYLEKE